MIAKLLGVLGLVAGCQLSYGSLVVCLYHNNALYVAADNETVTTHSRDTLDKTDIVRTTEPKVFPLSKTCCAFLTGYGAVGFTDPRTMKHETLSLLRELSKECTNALVLDQPLPKKINAVVLNFSRDYESFVKTHVLGGVSPGKLAATRVSFAGYNDSSDEFFLNSFLFQGTNNVKEETLIRRGSTNIGGRWSFQGEAMFLSALIIGRDEKLQKLCSSDLIQTLNAIESDSATKQNVVSGLVELFRLHKKHSAALRFDQGFIGEPYSVYTITKDKTVLSN